ncbi:MAG: peptidylprolyl isomerase [Desulfovibrionaceae bacterium]
MTQAKTGDTVRVHYTGTLDDGTVFDSSVEREPLEFTLGGGQVIPGFENGVLGMAPGETKSVSIAPAEAYGDYNPEAMVRVPRKQFPPDIDPEVGMMLQVRLEDGRPAHVVVVEVGEEEVALDGNHPLAGKTLTFALSLVEIR